MTVAARGQLSGAYFCLIMNILWRTKLSSKGGIVLPQLLRDARQWHEGTEFVVEEHTEGVLLRPVTPYRITDVSSVLGCTGYKGAVLSIDDMDASVSDEARRRSSS